MAGVDPGMKALEKIIREVYGEMETLMKICISFKIIKNLTEPAQSGEKLLELRHKPASPAKKEIYL